jgi:5-(carboxyamino)imidazole ribonucleotide synthase
LIEKKFINALGIPTVPFFEITVDNIDTVPANFFPGILKTARFGYDGKGQFFVDDRATLYSFKKQLSGTEYILEKKVSLDQEVSIILVRDEKGKSVCYPLARNTHRNGILIESVMPASDVDPDLNKMAQKYAKTIASSLNYVGVLTIEFFICEGSLLVNEIAPRPHNSGHQTIHGCKTSQFEQQVRMCLDLPIGSTEIQHATRLNNIMGDLWFATNSTSPKEPNWELFTCNGKVLKLYGKVEPRIGRKMGHIVEILDNK